MKFVQFVASFANAFQSLMASIKEKRGRLLKEWRRRDASLGEYQVAVDAALQEVVADRITNPSPGYASKVDIASASTTKSLFLVAKFCGLPPLSPNATMTPDTRPIPTW